MFLVVLTVMESRQFDKAHRRYPAEMTDFGPSTLLGERLQSIRKSRGMSVRELAEAIGGHPTQATIENIELGRKATVDVIQLLNISMALRVPPVFLLAPLGHPEDEMSLPGLSGSFKQMSVAEFDAWFAGLPDGARRPSSLEERTSTAELEALRLWKSQANEIARLEAVLELGAGSSLDEIDLNSTRSRLENARRNAANHRDLLRDAGWPI